MGEEKDKPKEKEKDPKKEEKKEDKKEEKDPKEKKKEDKNEENKEVDEKKKDADPPKDSKANQKKVTSTSGTPKDTKVIEAETMNDSPAPKYSEGRAKERKRLPHGAIVKTGQGREFKIERTLGTGVFGHVYKVSSLLDPYEVYAMKTEFNHGKEKNIFLKVEMDTLSRVNDEGNRYKNCFTKLIDYGKTSLFKFIVMDLLSHTLQDIFTVMCKREMPIQSAAYLAKGTAIAIDTLHHAGFIHRDIKPHNFAVGLGRFQCQIYILGFGVAKRFVDENKRIKPARKNARFVGTIKYCSRRCHEEQDLMKRDDLESWVYMCLEFFNEGNLNWDQMRTREEIYAQKKSLFNKLDTSHLKVPVAFIEIMKTINNLNWEDGVWKKFPDLMNAVCSEAKLTDDTRLIWETENMPPSRPRKKGAKNRVQNDDDSSERKRREEKAEKREMMAKKRRVEEELLKLMREIEDGDGPEDKKEEARRFIEEKTRMLSPNQRRRRSADRRRRGPTVDDEEEEDEDDYDDDDDSQGEDRHRRRGSHSQKRYRDEETKMRRQGSRKKPRSRLSQERTFEDKRGRKRSVKSKKSEKKRSRRKIRQEREEKLVLLETSPPRGRKRPSAEKIDEMDGERKEGKNKGSPEPMRSPAEGSKEKITDPSPAVTPLDLSDKGKKK